MIPLAVPLAMKPFVSFVKNIPWQVWAGIILVALMIYLRFHWIGVGVERCEKAQEVAQAKADAEAKVQAVKAPVIAQKAQDDIKPIIEERVRIIRETVTNSNCTGAYPERVQQIIREASASANRVR